MATKTADDKQQTKVVTGLVRLSYAHVWEPKAAKGSTELKFSSAVLIPKSDSTTKAKIDKVVNRLKEEVKAKNNGKLPKGFRLPLRDGDGNEEEDRDEDYAGHWFLNATSKTKPGIVDRDMNEITDKSEVYSGCYARVSLNFFSYDNVGVGIGVGLNNIQKIKDGPPLAGKSRPEDDFAEEFEDTDVDEGGEDDDNSFLD